MTSFLSRIRSGLAKTAQQIRERMGATPVDAPASTPTTSTSGRAVGVETLEALEDALLTADVGLPATERILTAVKAARSGSLRDRVGEVMLKILNDVTQPPSMTTTPHVILVVGVNGTGKTTTVGKLANLQKSLGHSVIVCAADTFRAAAVTFDAVSAAKARGREILIVDTAGRLHTKSNLMAELDKIRRIVGREVAGAPHEVLLVLDATVGQNGLVQAREFMAASGANGIVLTKLDGTAKGGVAVAIAHELNLPIRYIGVGEALDDLVPFDAQAYVDALFTDKW